MALKERHTGFGVDDEDDIVPLEDYPDAHKFPHNEFRIAHGTPRNYELEIAEFETQETPERVAENNLGVYVTLTQRHQDELDLLDIVSGAKMRAGFKKAKDVDQDIQDRYKENLPKVAEGAHANHVRMVNHDILDVYHAKELKEARVNDPEEIDFDAKTAMRVEYSTLYGGPENKYKREKRRKWLRQKLAEQATKP